jgi:hypothetical protein
MAESAGQTAFSPRAVSSGGEHFLDAEGVRGSNPLPATHRLLASPLVPADLDARPRRGGGYELERRCRAVGREGAVAATQHDRLDHQIHLVDEVRLEPRPRELRAAHSVVMSDGSASSTCR